MPQKKIKKTITETINLCDYKGCKEEVDFLYVQRFCKGCRKVFCNDHLFDIYDDKDSIKIVLCSYCSDIYEEKIEPFLDQIDKLYEDINKINKKQDKIREKMRKVCKKNYKEKIGEREC